MKSTNAYSQQSEEERAYWISKIDVMLSRVDDLRTRLSLLDILAILKKKYNMHSKHKAFIKRVESDLYSYKRIESDGPVLPVREIAFAQKELSADEVSLLEDIKRIEGSAPDRDRKILTDCVTEIRFGIPLTPQHKRVLEQYTGRQK